MSLISISHHMFSPVDQRDRDISARPDAEVSLFRDLFDFKLTVYSISFELMKQFG
jgi:hypothetical protein